MAADAPYFYPRPLRGGRRAGRERKKHLRAISIHALCEEGDEEAYGLIATGAQFLSTPSARRATSLAPILTDTFEISIHALCEEGDWQHTSADKAFNISIHALCEEGDSQTWANKQSLKKFLSTPSARRATADNVPGANYESISIHALCEEGDLAQAAREENQANFYPRPLRGGRPVEWAKNLGIYKISIHALCEEGDAVGFSRKLLTEHFYPRPLRGGRPWGNEVPPAE